jgi:hypothetical protein
MNFKLNGTNLLEKEYIFAIFFLILSLLIGILSYIKNMAYDYFLLLFLPSCIYLFYINKRIFPGNIYFEQPKYKIYLINSLFALFYLLSIAVVHTALYERPLLYFVLIFTIIILAGVEIIISPDMTGKMEFFSLLKIILIAFNLRWSIVNIFPSIIGNDTWYYARVAETVAMTGHIPSASEIGMYSYYPLSYLIIEIMHVLTLLNIKSSIFYSLGIIEIFSLVFIFLIGKIIGNTRIGLLATLFMAISGHHILYGSRELIPMSMSYFFFSVILYLLFKSASNTTHRKIAVKSLVLLFLSVLVITHTLSSAIMIFVLVFLHFGGEIYNKKLNLNHNINPITSAIILLAFIITIGYWSYVSGFVSNIIHVLKSAIEIDVTYAIANQVSYLNSGIYRFFDLAEERLWIFFFITGFLYSSKEGFRTQHFLLSFAGGFLAFSIFWMILGQSISLLPYRFYIFAYLLISFAFSVGILYFINIPKNKYSKITLFILIIILFSISSIAGPTANRIALYSNDDSLSNGFTQSEISAGDWFIQMYAQYNINNFPQGSSRYIGNLVDPLSESQMIGTDLYYTGYLTRYNMIPTTDFFPVIKGGNDNKLDSLIIRKKVLENSFLALAKYNPSESRYSEMIVEPQGDLATTFSEFSTFNKVYDSNSAIIFRNNKH